MNRLSCCIVSLFFGLYCAAENVVQIIPFKTTAGVVSNKNNVINIELTNSDDIWAIQFNLYLPDGMSLPVRSSGSLYTTLTDRSLYDDEEEELEFTCSSSYNSTGNYYTIMLYTATTNVISSGNGSILTVRYTTQSTMADGVYPITIRPLKYETGDHKQITTPEISSYVVIGDTNPLSTEAHVDMSGMTGYIPSFVVNKLNTDIASNTSLKSLNLSGTTVDNLGAELSVPTNDDLLWYTSDKASLNRTFTADKWSSVCLPVTLETSSLSGTPLIKKMDSYDTTEGYISLTDVTTMEKGKPYMVKTASNSKLFNNVAITASESVSSEPGSFTSGNLTMKGTYQYTTVSSTASTTYYGFSSGKFVGVNVGGTGRIQPFRAYLELNGAAGSRSIFLAEDGETTKIDKVLDDNQPELHLYNLQGMRMDNGCKTKGVFIRDGKKVIIK